MTLEHTLKINPTVLEDDPSGFSGAELQKLIKVTPTLAITPQEFEENRSSKEKLNDFLVRIGEEVITESYTRWLALKNNRRSQELITADCYLALKKIINIYDVNSDYPFYSYLKNLLYRKVIDLWREENEGSSRKFSGSTQRLSFEDPLILDSLKNKELDPSVIAEGIDLSEVFLSKITREHGQVISFRIDGYSSEEIALKIGKSPWTVYSHLQRIREEFSEFKEKSLIF